MNRYIPSILRVLVCLMSLLVSTAYLRAQSVRFPTPELITDRQGLPQAFVPSILQDKQGFIWAATRDGLCRYDGYRFKVFQPDPNGRPSLSFAGLNQIELDRHGRIWIVSERGDIDLFDPRTETFINLSRQAAFRRLIKPGLTFRLRMDRQDRLWLMLIGGGVVCWDPQKNQGQWFRHDPRQTASLGSNWVDDMVEDTDGTIWLATDNGLDRFEEATRSFTHLRHQPGNPQSLPEDAFAASYLRPNGEIILLSRHYLTLFRPRTGRIRAYKLPALGNPWMDPRAAIDRNGTIYFDQKNILFRFTDREGIQIVTRWNQRIDICRSLFIDRTNVLWVGTDGAGIRTYDLQPAPFQSQRYRQSFYQDLLTNDSLGLPPVSPAIRSLLNGLSSYYFRSTFDALGRFWFNVGSSDILRLDRKSGRAERFPLPIAFRYTALGYNPCSMTTDPQGRIWAVFGSAAFWFDEQKQSWVQFPHPIPHDPSINSPITELVVDDHYLWLASQARGLWRIDRRSGQSRQFVNRPGDATSLSSNSLYCLSADPTDAHRLWIGTFGNGLCLFDKRTGKFRRFTQADGLPNNVVYSALPDRYGYLWMGTNRGLCRMNRRTFTIQTFTRDDGIMADEFNRSHYVQFPEGKLVMGGLEGFTVFDPRQIGQDAFEPAVELTELQINNEVIKPDLPGPVGKGTITSANRSLLGTSVLGILPMQATNQLTLAHNQNYLTIQFTALQFNQLAKNRYRYRLEGLEEKWKETDRPEASYTNLSPGDYVLVLNASNTSGRWSQHVRKLTLIIQPPFWATWWAIALYSLIGLGVAWGLLQVYLNRLRLNQTIRLRQQEADQLRAVNTIKTNFFTNITHEFRTPLTLILTPTEQLKEHIHEPEHLLQNRHRLDTIDRNAHQLLGLINQLLDLSKLEASVMPIHESRGNLTDFIRHWLSPLTEQAATQELGLTFDSEITGDYWFDAEKLERIVYNLTANALKFTKVGTITVSLTLSSERIRLTVADTGIGIPAQHLPHIFDRFYQVGDTNAMRGTGIGLALVQELVQLQGGQIWVESQLKRGTTFVVELPYRKAEGIEPGARGMDQAVMNGTEIPNVETSDRAPSDRPGSAPQAEILIVEDNDELARFIADSLPQTYRVRRAVNGRDGLEQALEQLPDLIISDVMMPLMDGFTLCSQLKTDQRTSHIPIILLTAKSSAENRLAGLSLGADDYLTKPFQLAELQLRVRNQLVSKQRQREWIRASLSDLTSTPQAAPESIDPFLSRLYALIDANLSNSGFGLEQMLSELKISRTHLFRKVKALTDLTAYELLRNYRLKRGAELLRLGVSVSETAYQVGFESPAYFSKCFRELYHLSPREFAAQP